jgi:group I intron endonuclease
MGHRKNLVSMSGSRYLIYKYTSPSGKSYIGQTKDLRRRINQHKNPKSLCLCFARAISKYGYENFVLEIIETGLSRDEADKREEFYILHYMTLSPDGYNLKTGGGGNVYSEETRDKMRGRNNPMFGMGGDKHPMYNRKHTAESKLAMSKARLGIAMREETKIKIGNKSRGRHHSEETIALMRKRIVSEETKRKISRANSGTNSPMYGKSRPHSASTIEKIRCAVSKTYVVTFPSGEEMLISNMREFCRRYNLQPQSMCKVAKGTRNHHKNFNCRYYESKK